MSIRARILAVAALAVAMSAGSTFAQQEGLVNLDIGDNTVQVPIGIAAQVCGVSVEALTVGPDNTITNCEQPDANNQVLENFMASNAENAGSDSTQEGLVNISVRGNTVQVPIGIAAQVCGVSVDALEVGADNTVTNCEQPDANNQALQNFMDSNAGGAALIDDAAETADDATEPAN